MSAIFDKRPAWQMKLMWTAVVILGAISFGIVALSRGETVNAAWLVVASVCVYFVHTASMGFSSPIEHLESMVLARRPHIVITTVSIMFQPTCTCCTATILQP